MTEIVSRWPRDKAAKVRAIIEHMNLCSCGSNTHWECVLELLSEAETHTKDGFYRDTWFEFGAKVLDSWELLEHGTAIGFAWLTDDGKLLLEFLRDFGTDEDGHPVWASEFSWTEVENDDDWYGKWKSQKG